MKQNNEQEDHSCLLGRLLGAVDNNRSRQLCHRVFSQARELICIDSGNGEYTGQVVCGVRRSGKTYIHVDPPLPPAERIQRPPDR